MILGPGDLLNCGWSEPRPGQRYISWRLVITIRRVTMGLLSSVFLKSEFSSCVSSIQVVNLRSDNRVTTAKSHVQV
jgi:hypothetical protein